MSEKNILERAEEARQCLKNAVHDELVMKAKLGQNVIINRNGKPFKIPASEALLVKEESPEYGNPSSKT